MDVKAYIKDFWLSILKRKINMIVLVFFIAALFGLFSKFQSLFGIIAFLIAYSSIYYYNDLLDYKFDKKKNLCLLKNFYIIIKQNMKNIFIY